MGDSEVREEIILRTILSSVLSESNACTALLILGRSSTFVQNGWHILGSKSPSFGPSIM